MAAPPGSSLPLGRPSTEPDKKKVPRGKAEMWFASQNSVQVILELRAGVEHPAQPPGGSQLSFHFLWAFCCCCVFSFHFFASIISDEDSLRPIIDPPSPLSFSYLLKHFVIFSFSSLLKVFLFCSLLEFL